MLEMAPDRSLAELVGRLHARGDAAAIVAFGSGDATHWSARTLATHASRLAAGLVQGGVHKGDRTALFAANRPEWIAACLGALRAGATAMPLDVQFENESLKHAFQDATPKLVFTDAERARRLDALGIRAPRVFLDRTHGTDSWAALGGEVDLPGVEMSDPAALFYTSGTTGSPKGVPLTHGNLLSQLVALGEARIVDERDRALLPLPLHHVYPFVVGMLVPLELGVPIVMPRAMTGPEIVRAIREGRATVVIGVPRLYSALFDGIEARAAAAGPLAKAAFRALLGTSEALDRAGVHVGRRLFARVHAQTGGSLRLLASGGAPLAPALERKLRALGWQVAVGYGLTETAPLVAMRLPRDSPKHGAGRPLPGVVLRIDTGAMPGNRAEAEGVGEVLVRGPNVFAGYRGLEEKTREAFSADGWFRTGDLGRIDARGDLHLVGRTTEMIVTEGGKNVQPENVEHAYVAHEALREIGVFQRGKKLAAVIVPEPKALRSESARDVVGRALAESGRNLPSYERVSDFAITRESLPRTRIGKLRRHKLAERFERAKQGEERPRGPLPFEEMSAEDRELLENPPAKAVWDYLAERYPEAPLTPDSGLALDLGVDSLEWVELTLEIAQRAGVELSEQAIAEIDTVRDLLVALAEAREGEAPDLAANPENALDQRQQRWLAPLPRPARALARLLYALDRLLMRVLFRFDVHGRAHVETRDGALIFAPNHTSLLDPFAVAAALDSARLQDLYWGGWVGIAFRNAFVRAVSRLAQAVPVDPQRGALSSLAFAAAILKRGKQMVWFPEGGRSKDGRLGELKAGIAIVLEAHDVPVVPVRIDGTYEALPIGRIVPRVGRHIAVRFGEPVTRAALVQEGEGKDERARLLDALAKRIEALTETLSGESSPR